MAGLSEKSKYKYKISWYLKYASAGIVYDLKFDPIKAYLENTQDMIFRQEKELAKKCNEWNEEHEHNLDVVDAFDVYEIDIMNNYKFSDILNKSLCLTIYSIFENEFFKLCEHCKKKEDLKIGPKDINGSNNIGRCRKYIIKVLEIDLKSIDEEWSKIKKYQRIRNSIAHNNGIIKSPDDNILKFIEDSDGISADFEKFSIEIESIDFLKTMIDDLTGFMSHTARVIIQKKFKK